MHKKLGFSLIEILVAVVIIGLLATIVVPNLRRSKGNDARDKFVSELNALTGFALNDAIKQKAAPGLL
jgi:prepilin-type N-terminal cleavage/methylation domain